jgi:SAM-dependent methyltransferase
LTVSCPACGAPEASSPLGVPDREYGLEPVAAYVTCAACATLYQQPMPGGEELLGLYPPEYHSQTGQGPVGHLRHTMRLRRLADLVPLGRIGGDQVVLDYGCGNGDFLVQAASRHPGPRYYGFEIAEQREVVTLCDGAVTVVKGDLAHLLDELPMCHLVTMNHVIEHLPDPLTVVARLAERLAPAGLLEGQTPAAGSLEHRIFGGRWSGYHAPRHTVVFSPTGLARLLQRAGLADVTIRGAFNPAGLAVSLASLRQGPGGGRIRRQGAGWLTLLAMGTLVAPVDRLSGAPGIIDFAARRVDA